MKRALRCATVLSLVSAFAVALTSTTVTARSYGYRHHHHHHFGFHGRYNNYTSRAGLVQIVHN
jgi:hypothetical protein